MFSDGRTHYLLNCVDTLPLALDCNNSHTYSLYVESTRTSFILLGPVFAGCGAPCWQPASSEGTMFTAMAANARMHPCDRLQTIQSGFNNTTNLAMHTCLFLKCREAKLVNHSVAGSNSQKNSLFEGETVRHMPELSLLIVIVNANLLCIFHWRNCLVHYTCTYSTRLGRRSLLPDVPATAWDHVPTTVHRLSHYNGPVCKCERHWCHITSILIHPLIKLEQYLFSHSHVAAPHHPAGEENLWDEET